jgi:ketosteroid isomerase-like protein
MIGWLLIGGTLIACGGGVEREDTVAAVRQADIDFDRAVSEKDIEAFADLLAEDAVFFGTAMVEGRDAVVESWGPYFEDDPGITLRWNPAMVDVSDCGDLGYTRGPYRLSVRGEEGGVQRLGGTYVTIWKKSEDGRWRAVLDIGTPPQPLGEDAAAAEIN